MPRKELSWRLHFIMGALSYTLAGTDALKLIAELNPRETTNDEILLRRLAPFLLAGLTAPLPDLESQSTRELDGDAEIAPALHGAPCCRYGASHMNRCSSPGLRRRASSPSLALARCCPIAVARAARRSADQRGRCCGVFRKVMPPMSQTERDALEAGTVWWDGELFSGRPAGRKLLALPRADAHRRGAAFPRPRSRDALRDGRRLGDDATSTRTCRRTSGSTSRSTASSA